MRARSLANHAIRLAAGVTRPLGSTFRYAPALLTASGMRVVFSHLSRQARSVLQQCGVDASLILAAVEGALGVCRARREMGPLAAVEAGLLAFVQE